MSPLPNHPNPKHQPSKNDQKTILEHQRNEKEMRRHLEKAENEANELTALKELMSNLSPAQRRVLLVNVGVQDEKLIDAAIKQASKNSSFKLPYEIKKEPHKPKAICYDDNQQLPPIPTIAKHDPIEIIGDVGIDLNLNSNEKKSIAPQNNVKLPIPLIEKINNTTDPTKMIMSCVLHNQGVDGQLVHTMLGQLLQLNQLLQEETKEEKNQEKALSTKDLQKSQKALNLLKSKRETIHQTILADVHTLKSNTNQKIRSVGITIEEKLQKSLKGRIPKISRHNTTSMKKDTQYDNNRSEVVQLSPAKNQITNKEDDAYKKAQNAIQALEDMIRKKKESTDVDGSTENGTIIVKNVNPEEPNLAQSREDTIDMVDDVMTIDIIKRRYNDSLANGISEIIYKDIIFDKIDGYGNRVPIGEGSFKKVYKCRLKGTSTALAYMEPILDKGYWTVSDAKSYFKEIFIQSKLKHPNLLRIQSLVRDKPGCFLTEFCDNGSIPHALSLGRKRSSLPNKTLSWNQRISILIDILHAVDYLHTQTPKIIHFDLKGLNVLLDPNYKAKVCDFGLSHIKSVTRQYQWTASCDKRAGGTVIFYPPEQLLKAIHDVDEKCDVYAVGGIFIELFGDCEPWYSFKFNAEALFGKIYTYVKQGNDFIPVTGLERIKDTRIRYMTMKCLWVDPKGRPSFTELIRDFEYIKSHPWNENQDALLYHDFMVNYKEPQSKKPEDRDAKFFHNYIEALQGRTIFDNGSEEEIDTGTTVMHSENGQPSNGQYKKYKKFVTLNL